jgi:Domain of unknown function (DUF4157)
MSQERELNHASNQAQVPPQVDIDLAPGRSSLSAKLEAPDNPVISGLIQRKAERDANGVAEGADSAIATASSSSGQSLPGDIQRKFEASLGTDLSSVRVHTGGESQNAAHAVGAKAYTMGQDIHFGAGHYDPSSSAGEHLLAHEVAHTVQQQGGSSTRQNKLEVSGPQDAAEHEADRAADAMVSGAQATISGFSGVHRRIMRDADPNPGGGGGGGGGDDHKDPVFEPKMSFDLGEIKLPSKELKYVTLAQSIKAKGSVELAKPDGKGGAATAGMTAGPTVTSKGGVGAKEEVTIAKQGFHTSLLGMQFDGKAKEKASFELSSEQLKVQAGLEVRGSWPDMDWLKAAGDLNFIFAGVKWADIKKDPDKVKVAAVEAAVGASGEGSGTVPGINRFGKSSLTVQYVGSAAPNWVNILVEASKEVAKEGAVDAGTEAATTSTVGSATAEAGAGAGAATDVASLAETAIVIDSGAVASAAAAIIFPLGAAALMVAGFMQTEKNIAASHAATNMGLKLRSEGNVYVKGYVATIFGEHASGRGAIDADVKVAEYMAASKKSRADACADLAKKNDRAKLTADILQKFRDDVYPKGCAEFDAKFASQFGIVEHIGETWGMRGVFRKDFYNLLYSNG